MQVEANWFLCGAQKQGGQPQGGPNAWNMEEPFDENPGKCNQMKREETKKK